MSYVTEAAKDTIKFCAIFLFLYLLGMGIVILTIALLG